MKVFGLDMHKDSIFFVRFMTGKHTRI